jgi:TatA/E family protein of Tat protein translocase
MDSPPETLTKYATEVRKMGLENPVHIVLILVVVMLVFGAKRLPEMGRGLGQGMREFKESIATAKTEIGPVRAEHPEVRVDQPVEEPLQFG